MNPSTAFLGIAIIILGVTCTALVLLMFKGFR